MNSFILIVFIALGIFTVIYFVILHDMIINDINRQQEKMNSVKSNLDHFSCSGLKWLIDLDDKDPHWIKSYDQDLINYAKIRLEVLKCQ